ncbi:hypothetical protein SAMN05443248_3936 [Bradyrhizobium erythrophlei]|uniref:Uncharacterized protein n=1 Tax=Bradyrhizobium erythrophlei TaxID=1437360 RepID=A0A1M5QSP9_9BRAD|nr:hypothetical protein SAMN05443248_3936 [Bradyrhizobium erythrophlei]
MIECQRTGQREGIYARDVAASSTLFLQKTRARRGGGWALPGDRAQDEARTKLIDRRPRWYPPLPIFLSNHRNPDFCFPLEKA